MKFLPKSVKLLAMSASVLALTSCGGGSGGGNGGGGGNGNVAPTFTGATSFTFAENTNVIFQLTITDPDSATVTITDDNNGDGALFSINTDGVVSATTPDQTFNFEDPQDVNSDNVYEQSITLSDGIASTTTVIRVTITDTDEQPVCKPLAVQNFNENVSGVIGSLSAASEDPEGGAVTSFALESVGRETNVEQETLDLFSVDSATGNVSLSSAMDAEKMGTEGAFITTFTTTYSNQAVQCSTNFQLVDVAGVVKSGVKLTGDQKTVNAVGDIDNDGITDIIVTEPVYDMDGAQIGQNHRLIFGVVVNDALAADGAEEFSLTGLASPQSIQLLGEFPNSGGFDEFYRLQYSVLGDIDGDGLDDIAAALPADSNFEDDLPIAFIIWGDALTSDADGIIDLTALSAAQGLKIFGLAGSDHSRINVSSGQMDGAGLPDLLIGTPQFELNPPEVGLNFVIFGETLSSAKASGRLDLSGLPADQGVSFSDGNPSEAFGDDVALAGDINGDGISELIAVFNQGIKIITSQEIVNTANGMQNMAVDRLILQSNRILTPSQKPGDSDGDGLSDVLLAMPGDFEFAALAFASGINAMTPDETIFLNPNSPEFETIIFGGSGDGGTESLAASADFIGDLDGDNRDEIVLRYVPIAPRQSAIYIIKASALDTVADNFFNIETMTAAQGLKIIDSGAVDMTDHNIAIIEDIDNDSIPDIGISGPQNSSRGYIIPSADIVAALTNGVTELNIQDNFNDESGG